MQITTPLLSLLRKLTHATNSTRLYFTPTTSAPTPHARLSPIPDPSQALKLCPFPRLTAALFIKSILLKLSFFNSLPIQFLLLLYWFSLFTFSRSLFLSFYPPHILSFYSLSYPTLLHSIFTLGVRFIQFEIHQSQYLIEHFS